MKKKLTTIVTALVLTVQLFCVNLVPVYGLEVTDITSNEALAVDMNTDQVLFSKNTKSESVHIASLTKIMTYILAVENISDLNMKITVPAGTRAEMNASGASIAGLEDGYEYTAKELLYGLMLPSGCDAADVLAKHVGGGDYDAFINMMNAKAAELGMIDTIFYTATGLEKDGNINSSTEQDLYKLAKYAFDKPHFIEIVGTEWYTITGEKGSATDEDSVQNTNSMIGDYNGDEYYYIYSLGGKTGSLSTAGKCLISFAAKGDLEVVTITLGVPGNYGDYHLRDHRKIFDYVFEKYTGNITIDNGPTYRSVNIGKKIQIKPTTSEETEITWKSSDETVATVDEKGIVTGKKLGQAKIIATTETGNKDQTYVSVGFYNGIDVRYSSGPSDSNGKLGYGKIDWSVVKDAGIDFAIIRLGYGLYGNDSDPYFVENIEGAFKNDIDIMVSYDSYTDTEAGAIADAEYIMKYMEDNIPSYMDEVKLPIVYNLFKSSVGDMATLTEVSLAFDKKMNEYGYETIIEQGRTNTGKMGLKEITEEGIGLYMIWKPYYPNYGVRMSVVKDAEEYKAGLWQYRGDAYLGAEGIAKDTTMAAMYMDYIDLGKEEEIIEPEPEKPTDPDDPTVPEDPTNPEDPVVPEEDLKEPIDQNDSDKEKTLNDKKNAVDTSDSFNIKVCVAIMLLSLATMIAVLRRRSSC